MAKEIYSCVWRHLWTTPNDVLFFSAWVLLQDKSNVWVWPAFIWLWHWTCVTLFHNLSYTHTHSFYLSHRHLQLSHTSTGSFCLLTNTHSFLHTHSLSLFRRSQHKHTHCVSHFLLFILFKHKQASMRIPPSSLFWSYSHERNRTFQSISYLIHFAVMAGFKTILALY